MSIWHEPGESPPDTDAAVFIFLGDHLTRQYARTHTAQSYAAEHPWCYESDLVAMLRDMQKTKKKPAREKSDDLFFHDRKPCSCGAPVDSVFLTGNGDSLTWLHCNRCRKWTTGQKSIARAVAEWNELVSKSSPAGDAKSTGPERQADAIRQKIELTYMENAFTPAKLIIEDVGDGLKITQVAVNEPKSACGKVEWTYPASMQIGSNGLPKVTFKKCIIEETAEGIKVMADASPEFQKAVDIEASTPIAAGNAEEPKPFPPRRKTFHVPEGKPHTKEDMAVQDLLLKSQEELLKAHLDKVEGEIKAMPSAFTVSPDSPLDPNLPNLKHIPPLPSKLASFMRYDKDMGLVNDQAPDHVVSPQAKTAKPAAGSVEQTLEDRKKTHGDFRNHSAVTQSIKHAMRCRSSWNNLTDAQQEALDMIAHKIGRVLAGNPNHDDHWHDIAGYAMLVERQIKEKAKAAG